MILNGKWSKLGSKNFVTVTVIRKLWRYAERIPRHDVHRKFSEEASSKM